MLGHRLKSSADPGELSVFEELQDFHVGPIADAGSLYCLVKSYPKGIKEHHHVDTCKQGDHVYTGFFDGYWKTMQLFLQIVRNGIELPLSQKGPTFMMSSRRGWRE